MENVPYVTDTLNRSYFHPLVMHWFEVIYYPTEQMQTQNMFYFFDFPHLPIIHGHFLRNITWLVPIRKLKKKSLTISKCIAITIFYSIPLTDILKRGSFVFD